MKSIARLHICALSLDSGVPAHSASAGITVKARNAMASLTSRLGCVAQRLRDASILLVALGMTLCSMAQAQTANEWTWMGGSNNGYMPGVYGTEGTFAPANIPGSRQKIPTWTDASGNIWIFGGDGYNDVWEFNPATNEWAWMAGNSFESSEQPGVYGAMGTPAAANVPGTRYGALRWVDKSGNFWLFGGVGADANGTQGDLNDLWEFSPTTLLWTWMGGSSTIPGSGGIAGVYGTLGTPAAGNYPGSRNTSATWTDSGGNFWLFAGYGYDSNDNNLTLSDLWEFNPSTLQWTWMGGSRTGNAAPIYGTLGIPAPGNIPGGRGSDPMAWVDKGGNFWLFGGGGIGANYEYGQLNDLWQFNPSTNQWTWMGGSSIVGPYCVLVNGYTNCGQSGVYGTLGTPSAANIPGARFYGSSWIDSSGNLWLFGGQGYDANGDGGYLNDLWEYDTFTGEWTWMGGSSTLTDNSGVSGVYGTLGTQAAGNSPGGRNSTSSWTDTSGNLWLFAGYGVDGPGNLSELNEVWEYQPPSSSLPAAATPSFSLAPGNYTTVQTVTISDATAGATIYYTTNGTAPTINASVYSGAIAVSSPESIEAIAVAGGYSNSAVAAAFYNVNLPIAATPTLSLATGTYIGSQTVTISDVTPGATIYYTTDGTMPNTGSAMYGGSITVSSTETLNAIAVASEYANSAVATAAYTITPLSSTSPGEWTWVGGSTSGALGVWGTLGTPAAANIPGDRQSSAQWTDSSGHFWLFGGNGADANGNWSDLNDLWEYNPATSLWTWVSGSSTTNCGSNGCFQPGVYGTKGTPASGNIPGSRQQATTWIDSSGNLWLFGGQGYDAGGNYGDLNDLWEFSPTTGEWTWVSGTSTVAAAESPVYGTQGTPAPGNMPGGRFAPASWIDKAGHLWLFGGSAYDTAGNFGALSDLWEFNPSTSQWAWIGGATTAYHPGVYGTLGTPSAANIPGSRTNALTWTDNAGNFWIFGGYGFDVNNTWGILNDLWQFNPSTNQWTWMSGSTTLPCIASGCFQTGVYGTLGTPAAGNVPGSRNSSSTWTDASGNLWLFDGFGYDSTSAYGALNELWEFNPFTNQWAWMGGSNTIGINGGAPGVYGTLGTPAAGNIPGGRYNAAAWTASNGNLWLMGGCGYNASDIQGCFNDLWEYQPSDTVSSSPAATPSFSLAPGNYTTIQILTITDATSGATIYYTTNGTAPNINSAVYSGPITISSPEAFEAMATASGYSNSAVAAAYYNVVVPVTAAPTFSLAAGGYDTPQSVTISDATPGATIYYAINGTPTTGSTVYSGPITISSTETLEAIAAFSGYANSAVASAAYTITIPAAVAPGEWTWVGGKSTVGSSQGYPGVYGTLGTPAPGNIPGARSAEVSWTDKSGNLWLFGGLGFDVNGGTATKRLNDVWMLSPLTNEWTWMGGSTTNQAPGVCGTMGTPAAGNIPGARYSPSSWTDSSGNFWLFGGSGYDCNGNEGPLSDLWEFNPTTNLWTWVGGSSTNTHAGVYGTLGAPAVGNIPGSRENGMSWVDSSGNLWLFGGQGLDSTSSTTKGYLNDLWMFNPQTKLWTWMGGSNVDGNIGSTVEPTPGVYGTMGVPAPGNVPSGREYSNAWTDSGGNFWLFGGDNKATGGSTIYFNDLWEFNTTTNEWTWVSGSSAQGGDQNGVYGTVGMPASTNAPGSRTDASSWTDVSGNLWLFGGSGYDHGTGEGYLNDLWEFNPSTNEWTWMAGSNTRGPGGTYGTLGIPSSTNTPGVRYLPATWRDSLGNFWMFGGEGKDANATFANLNDLWEYQPANGSLQAAATPTFSVPAGNYTSVQTVTISDATAGATIYYTTNGTAPNINSSVYSGAITVSSTETLEAVAVAGGYSNSGIASAAYSVILPTATPVISLASGTYDQLQTVTISDATPGATIYYAINGTPTTGSTVYSGSITVSSTETLEAIALAGGYSTSAVATASYTDNVPAATSSGEWTWVGGNSNLTSPTGFPGVYGTEGTPAPGNIPGARYYPASWTDSSGHFWLFGGGGFDVNDANGRLGDLWEFNPSTNEWTWVGGSQTENSSGVYGTMGVAAPGNVPGARQTTASWIDKSGNLWLFGGNGYDGSGHSGYLDDLWEYTPSTNQWTWMGGSSTIPGNGSGGVSGEYGTLGVPAAGNYPGSRQLAMSWVDSNGNFWLFGGPGYDSAGTKGNLNDLWMFNPSTQLWTWMGGSNTVAGGLSGVYGTLGTPAAGNVPGSRQNGMTWTDSGGNLWLFGGQGASSGQLNDLWEFSPSTNQWTWMGGSTSANQSGVYGTQGNPAAGNFPGGRVAGTTWTDQGGNLWLFGGDGYDNSGNLGQLNDLWEFSPSTLQWTWIDGGSTMTTSTFGTGLPGVYGTLGIPAAANMPGGHYGTARWTGSNGNFWMFTGTGFDAFDHSNHLNDLWEYQPANGSLQAAATPTFSVPAGNYTSVQTVTISDATAGATIYYTTNGTAPNINSSVYSGAITVSSTETLEAVAIASGYSNSGIASAAYSVILPTATPVISLASGTYDQLQTVTISDATPGATIYYAINGTPTTGSTVYSGSITVSSTETLEAIALAGGYSTSAVATASYTDNVPAATSSGEWTWVGGKSIVGSANGLPGIYGTLGVPSASNVPGSRIYQTTWKDSNGNFWMFGGSGYDVNGNGGLLNDIWELNPSTNIWTWMGGSNTFRAPGVYGTLGVPAAGNIPGARNGSASWVDGSGNLWLFGGEAVNPNGGAALSSNDLWKFSPITNQWTWMGGSDVPSASGSYGTLGSPSANNIPGARYSASSWMDTSGDLWLFGGYGLDSAGVIGYLNDLWEFVPSTGQWVWISGSSTVGSNLYRPGVYGTEGIPAAGNVPGGREEAAAWTDRGGNFWLFGGSGSAPELNDLWEFNPSTIQWTWMGGSSAPNGNERGVYGTLGTAAAINMPGGRDSMVNWTDQNGNFWLFGGDGFGSAGGRNFLSDLWEFNPFTNEWTWMSGSNSTSQPGEFGTLGIPGSGTMPGSRDADSGWIDRSGNLWLLAGHGLDGSGANRYLNDLWEYQPANGSLQAAATPTFSVPAGNYTSVQTVTISDATAGATIYYTTNGTAPNINSSVYSGAITVSSTETLEAVAVAGGYSNSAVATAAYSVILPTATPVISLASGTYDQPQTVTISDATPGATIYYAINGTPTTGSTVYSGSITVSSTETLEAIALAGGYSTSATATASYTDNVPAATSAGEWTWVSGSSVVGAGEGASGVLGTLGTPAAGNVPGSRKWPAYWTDSSGNFWLFGGSGHFAGGGQGLLNDLWEFNKATNLWTWMGGSTTFYTSGVYGTQGVAAAGNMPGSRSVPTSWQDGSGNLWLFGGAGTDSTGATGYLNDLWKYNPTTNQWTWMSGSSTGGSSPQSGVYGTLGTPSAGNMPGGRDGASGWTDSNGNLWLFGGYAYDANGTFGYLNDLWEFSPSANEWTWMGGSNSLGCSVSYCAALATYGALGTPAAGNTPGGRKTSASWTDSGGNFWLFGGYVDPANGDDLPTELNDLWEFSPSTNQWTWMGGSSAPGGNQSGVYGTMGTPAATNIPGGRDSEFTWTDAQGNLWLFGGEGYNGSGGNANLGDLWEYSPFTNEWTWMVGSNNGTNTNSLNRTGVVGTIGIPAATNFPGSRGFGAGWVDQSGNLWLNGGYGEDASKAIGYLNDLWVYQPAQSSMPQVAPPVIDVTVESEGSAQEGLHTPLSFASNSLELPANTVELVTISDATPGATIYYTTTGASPTAASTVYTGPFTISPTQTVMATATAIGYATSRTTNMTASAPAITWATPASISYGTALSASQLNATANVAGTFTYSPAAGTVLTAGTQTLSVTFTPADTKDYTTVSATVSLTVNQITSQISWATPAAITYGTALSGTQLNATGSVAGTLAYSPATGTVLSAGMQTLSVTFTPTDTTDYTTATATVQLTVNQATPTISWATPAAITYGTALSGTQLDATAPVAGTFTYTPAAGTVLGAGSQSLSVSFAPTDTTDYTTATGGTTLTVNKATPTISWATPAAITYGTALSGTQLDAIASTAGTFVYSPAAGTVLPGGSQTLTVTFTPGDTTDYTTATGSTTLTVNPAAQTITFSGPASPVTYGVSPITLSATASSGLGVTFSATGPATVSGNTLTITGAGSVGITASQAGNNDYTAATPVSRTLTVNKATPTASLTSSENSGAYGASVTLTATLTGAGVSPTGTVTFFNRGTSLGTATLSGGVATLTTTALPVGFDFVTASYAGDTNYLTTTSNAVRIIVSKAAQTISFTLASPVTYGVSPIALSATASSGLAVTFSATGPATVSGSTLTITGAGTVVVTASQAGDADYSAATNVTQTLVVTKATPTITWAAPAAINYGTALSGTQLDASASVGGTFVYSPTWGTVLAAGSQTLSVTFTPTNSTDYTAATATVTLIVNKIAPTITWATPAAITYGTALSGTQLDASATVGGTFVYSPASGTVLAAGSQTLSVTFTPTNTTDYATATKTVTLTVNKATPTITWATPASISYGTALGATQLDARSSVAGTFAYAPAAGTVLAVGTHTLSVTLTPTDTTDYNTATATVSLTVTKASQTITFTPPATPVVYGVAPIALSASSTSGLAVTFSIVSGPGAVSGSTLTITGVGTVVVAANQAGNADYTAATQVTQTVVVNKATPGIALTSSASTATHGASVTFTATLTAGGAEPTGTVTFYNGGTAMGTGTLNGSGVATYSTNTLAVGTHSITATYGGNTNYLTVTSTAVSVTVSFP